VLGRARSDEDGVPVFVGGWGHKRVSWIEFPVVDCYFSSVSD